MMKFHITFPLRFALLALGVVPFNALGATSEESALAETNDALGRVSAIMNEAPSSSSRIASLEELRPELLDNTSASSFLSQALGWEYSFVGQHLKALEAFDDRGASGSLLVDDVKQLQTADAVSTILQLAADRQILMINEAHHVAQHRVLTRKLLEGLWSQGYRYFAAEAFGQAAEAELAANGYPTKNTGYYIQEPLFANLVSHAMALGFKPVSYDFINGGTEEREKGAAQVIARKIFEKDPEARVVIHVGFSHINEQSWLASELRQMLGIDPLTVNQTDLAEASTKNSEPKSYTWLVENKQFELPVVLLDAEGNPWSLKKDEYDLNIVWPRTRYEGGRPTWAALDRTPMPVDTAWCQLRLPCTVEVFRHNEENELASDRVLVESSEQDISAFLHPGANTIIVSDLEGRRLHTVNVGDKIP